MRWRRGASAIAGPTRSCSTTSTSSPRRTARRTSCSCCSTSSSRAAASWCSPRRVPLAELAGVEPRLLTRARRRAGGRAAGARRDDAPARGRARYLRPSSAPPDPELAAYLAGRPADSMRAVQACSSGCSSAAEAQRRHGRPRRSRARCWRAAGPAPARRAARPRRSSGMVAPGVGGMRSREKMVWEWPEVADRVIEEWR